MTVRRWRSSTTKAQKQEASARLSNSHLRSLPTITILRLCTRRVRHAQLAYPRQGRQTRGGKGPLIQDEISGTLSTVNNQSLVCLTGYQEHACVSTETTGTLCAHASKEPPVIAFKYHQGAANGSGTDESEPIAGYHNLNDNTTAECGINSVVRRLTPLECERLQGFPDNHTRIPWKGKPAEECPDSLRYKACGNSMAVPVMRWLGERIEAVDRL